jgi:serine/threonine protein kinase
MNNNQINQINQNKSKNKYKKYCKKIILLKGGGFGDGNGNGNGNGTGTSSFLPYSLPTSRRESVISAASSRRTSAASAASQGLPVSRNAYALNEPNSVDVNDVVCCVGSVGQGRHGKVLKSIDKKSGRTVIIKKITKTSREMALNGQQMTYENYKNQIRIEINLLKSLNHPNIIKFYNHTDTEKDIPGNPNSYKEVTFEIYMEDICGYNLAAVSKNLKGLNFQLMSKYIGQVLQALQYLHSPSQELRRTSKVIHMDIKGENALLSNTGVIKLIDFGESIEVPIANNTFSLQFKGSSMHIAPELYDSNLNARQFPIDQLGKSDIWSLGVMMIELFVGEFYNPKNLTPLSHMNDIINCIIKNLFLKISELLHNRDSTISLLEYDSIDEGTIAWMFDDIGSPDSNKKQHDILCFLNFLTHCLNPDFNLRKSAKDLQSNIFITQPDNLQFDMNNYNNMDQFYFVLYQTYPPTENNE